MCPLGADESYETEVTTMLSDEAQSVDLHPIKALIVCADFPQTLSPDFLEDVTQIV